MSFLKVGPLLVVFLILLVYPVLFVSAGEPGGDEEPSKPIQFRDDPELRAQWLESLLERHAEYNDRIGRGERYNCIVLREPEVKLECDKRGDEEPSNGVLDSPEKGIEQGEDENLEEEKKNFLQRAMEGIKKLLFRK